MRVYVPNARDKPNHPVCKNNPMKLIRLITLIILVFSILSGCNPVKPAASDGLNVIAAESFLADIVQHVAGDRLQVQLLVPAGVDPHTFELTPADAARLEDADMLIINGGGLEEWLHSFLDSMDTDLIVVEASAGLASRQPADPMQHADHAGGDPHFWLNPLNVTSYVRNIRDALITEDPQGKDVYTRNAETYSVQLQELDAWIKGEVNLIPPEARLFISNHDSFGYFAHRYGFTVIGTLLTSASTSASPSPRQLAELVDKIRSSGCKLILLEAGANSQIADQIAAETGIKVVNGLLTHSITDSNGPAPAYIDMMRFNTNAITSALTGK